MNIKVDDLKWLADLGSGAFGKIEKLKRVYDG